MPTIDWNQKVWDSSYQWPKDGDEWSEMAEFCGVPYEKWKDSLAKYFLIANLREHFNVLEIGPGHGRWSAMIPNRIPKGTLHLVDLSPKCIDFCKGRLAGYNNVQYYANNGKNLPKFSGDIDFVWSFDTFVHIEEPEVKSYVRDMFVAMKRQTMGVIHHCGSPTPDQKQRGMRSSVTGRQFKQILSDVGFYVVRQVDSWDGGNVKMAGDLITVFVKP